jgi:hypothetical protein
MTVIPTQAPPQSRLRAHLSLARISNSPTVVTNVLAGASFAGVVSAAVDFPIITIVMLCVALVAFYTAGMYLNDLCDYEIDRKERPERPLVQGIVTKTEVWGVTLGLFAIGHILLLLISPRLLLPGIILTALIVLYDVWHKSNPLSPLVMGANRFMVYAIAFLAFEPALRTEILVGATILLVYILGLTFIAKSENQASFSRYWPLIVLLFPALYYGVQSQGLELLFAIAFAAWVLYCASLIYRKHQIRQGIGALLAGISLLDAAALAANGIVSFAVLAVAAFALTIVLQRVIKGT